MVNKEKSIPRKNSFCLTNNRNVCCINLWFTSAVFKTKINATCGFKLICFQKTVWKLPFNIDMYIHKEATEAYKELKPPPYFLNKLEKRGGGVLCLISAEGPNLA